MQKEDAATTGPASTPTEEFPLLGIRFEGNIAQQHELDLNQLGQSLQGFARIFAVSAHFLKTSNSPNILTHWTCRLSRFQCQNTIAMKC